MCFKILKLNFEKKGWNSAILDFFYWQKAEILEKVNHKWPPELTGTLSIDILLHHM